MTRILLALLLSMTIDVPIAQWVRVSSEPVIAETIDPKSERVSDSELSLTFRGTPEQLARVRRALREKADGAAR